MVRMSISAKLGLLFCRQHFPALKMLPPALKMLPPALPCTKNASLGFSCTKNASSTRHIRHPYCNSPALSCTKNPSPGSAGTSQHPYATPVRGMPPEIFFKNSYKPLTPLSESNALRIICYEFLVSAANNLAHVWICFRNHTSHAILLIRSINI